MAFFIQSDQTEAIWYVSPLALGIYFSIVLLFVIGFVLWQVNTINKLKSQLKPDSTEPEKTEVEADAEVGVTSEHDKELQEIKDQLKTKTIELATIAKENEEKSAVLKSIKQLVDELVENPTSLNRKCKDIYDLLDSHLGSIDKTFEIQIDELHQELFKKLRKKYPELTSNDLRLCAYIKIGFNSKELAELLSIKPSSVYISRSRLRKKLGLDTDIDLHSFLNSV